MIINFIKLFIGAIALWTSAYLVGKILFNDNSKCAYFEIIIKIIVCSLLLVIINIINCEMLHGIFKISIVYLLQCIFFKIVFNKPLFKILIISLIWYLFLCVSEIIVVLSSSYILNFFGTSIVFMKNNTILNIIISFTNLLIIYIGRGFLSKILENSNLNLKEKYFLFIIILITLALLLYRIPLYKWNMDLDFIITMIILLCFCIIGIFLLKQNSDIEKTTSMYQQVVKYSNTTNKVLEDYRMIGHEHKNQLSIIRQMISKDKNEAIEYIDSLIEMRNDIKYKWVAELNKLPLEGLKGLINYKLIEAEEKNIKTSVIISKEVSKLRLNKLTSIQKDHLYSIVGVYLDNAIQATVKAKNKEMNIDIYKEKNKLVFIIGNTFVGTIELEKIDEYGYTTKGKNHGVGLHIVKTIVEADNIFSHSRKIVDNYYIQELRIEVNNLNKKKK